MLMQLGQFTFGLPTLAFTEMQRQLEWRHADNARVGALPGVQYLGPQSEKITLTGCAVPEIGDRRALDTLRKMADAGAAYVLQDGTGQVYGAYVIESLQQTGSHFVAEGVPRKVAFTLALKQTADAAQGDPAGGADDNASTGQGEFDGWDWWLGGWV